MNFLIPLIIGLATPAGHAAANPGIAARSVYKIIQHSRSSGGGFEVHGDDAWLGRITRHPPAAGHRLELLDQDERVIVRGHPPADAAGLDVRDCEGQLTGLLRQTTSTSFFGTTIELAITGPDGRPRGRSDEVSRSSTSFNFRGVDGRVNATLSRASFDTFGDTWTLIVDVDDPAYGHVLILAAAHRSGPAYRRGLGSRFGFIGGFTRGSTW